jgi:hypothetical protein
MPKFLEQMLAPVQDKPLKDFIARIWQARRVTLRSAPGTGWRIRSGRDGR